MLASSLVNLAAITQPAGPPPTIMKSNSRIQGIQRSHLRLAISARAKEPDA